MHKKGHNILIVKYKNWSGLNNKVNKTVQKVQPNNILRYKLSSVWPKTVPSFQLWLKNTKIGHYWTIMSIKWFNIRTYWCLGIQFILPSFRRHFHLFKFWLKNNKTGHYWRIMLNKWFKIGCILTSWDTSYFAFPTGHSHQCYKKCI